MSDYLGQVFVYSTSACPHCKAAKNTLKNVLNLEFHEISVEDYPERKQEISAITKIHTVPQIFFNDHFIGGNSDLQELVNDPPRLQQMLQLLTTPLSLDSIHTYVHSSEDEDDEILSSVSDVEDEHIDMVKRMQDPVTGVSVSDRMYHLKIYKKCFIGHAAVDWICKDQGVNRQRAQEIGNALMDKFYFRHVVNDHKFKDKYLFYRFVNHESSNALNILDLHPKEPKPASEISQQLRKAILRIYDEFLSDDGKAVDYVGLVQSETFSQYETIAAELQRVDLQTLSENDRKAFFLNIYNTLVIHGYVRLGVPKGSFNRLKFYKTTSYVIGGQMYSLDDIEHGILRCNQKAPLAFSAPISNHDPRHEIVLQSLDPRIHFALVCGAKGCPPIRTYAPENIDEQLDAAAAAFLESGCVIEGRTIHLSKILSWYRGDFGSSKELFRFITRFLPDEKRAILAGLLKSGNYKIAWQKYDWSQNSAE